MITFLIRVYVIIFTFISKFHCKCDECFRYHYASVIKNDHYSFVKPVIN